MKILTIFLYNLFSNQAYYYQAKASTLNLFSSSYSSFNNLIGKRDNLDIKLIELTNSYKTVRAVPDAAPPPSAGGRWQRSGSAVRWSDCAVKRHRGTRGATWRNNEMPSKTREYRAGLFHKFYGWMNECEWTALLYFHLPRVLLTFGFNL